jgi:hypothetical protein
MLITRMYPRYLAGVKIAGSQGSTAAAPEATQTAWMAARQLDEM